MAFTGSRGSGKTLSMVHWVKQRVKKDPRTRVWSNFKIHFSDNGSINGWQSFPLEMDYLLEFSQDLRNGIVVIDELELFVDSMRGNTIMNRLIGYLTMQTRKRNLGVYFGIISFFWADRRLRFLTDMIFQCRDLATTPYGLKRRLPRGHHIIWKPVDYSGELTGVRKMYLPTRILNAKGYWNNYDTYETMDPYQAFTSVDLTAKRQKLTPGEDEIERKKPGRPRGSTNTPKLVAPEPKLTEDQKLMQELRNLEKN